MQRRRPDGEEKTISGGETATKGEKLQLYAKGKITKGKVKAADSDAKGEQR